MSKKPAQEDGGPPGVAIGAILGVVKLISFVIASWVYSRHSDTAQPRLDSLGELGFVYLSVYSLSFLVSLLFVHTQHYRHHLDLPRPDQALFKVTDNWKDPAAVPKGFAVMDDRGVAGSFNRSMRSYYNYLEYLPVLLTYAVLSGYVLPFPTFVTSLVVVFSRLVYCVGYTSRPLLRFPGFVVSNLALSVLESYTLIAGLRALGWW
jgi:hypothetical protein